MFHWSAELAQQRDKCCRFHWPRWPLWNAHQLLYMEVTLTGDFDCSKPVERGSCRNVKE